MSVRRHPFLWCDHEDDNGRRCPMWADRASGLDAAALRKSAKRIGWTVGQPGGKDFCPDHKPGVSADV